MTRLLKQVACAPPATMGIFLPRSSRITFVTCFIPLHSMESPVIPTISGRHCKISSVFDSIGVLFALKSII